MSNPPGSIRSPQWQRPEPLQAEPLRARAAAALVPFLADGSASNDKAARVAADAVLDDYNAATPKELQLATQIVALGWAAMSCLRAAVAAKNLSLNEILRLHDDADALDRSAQKDTTALAACRQDWARLPPATITESTQWDEDVFQLLINHALEKLTNANARVARSMTTLAPVAPNRPQPLRFVE
jgi:hypothetical protein